MVATIVGLALVSGFFLGASALANWWAEETPAQALDAIAFVTFILAVCLAAGHAHGAVQWVVAALLAIVAGAWLSDVAEHASERLPNVPG